MTAEELAEFNNTNQQLRNWEQLGIIKNLNIAKGTNLETSKVNFEIDEKILPLILKDYYSTKH